MKRFTKACVTFTALALCLVLSACAPYSFGEKAQTSPSPAQTDSVSPSPLPMESPLESVPPEERADDLIVYTDSLGRELNLSRNPQRVVSLLGSFSELWELSGGTLVGITSDALEENRVKNSPDAMVLGTNNDPNIELLLSLEPDLVLLSSDTPKQQEMNEQLDEAGITHVYLKVEAFEDYLSALRLLTDITGREDLYEKNGLDVETQINDIRAKIAEQEQAKPLVLLIRAMGKGAKGKASELMPGLMLKELGAEHLAERYPSLLDELSMEIILKDDPEYIFIVTMGDSEEALNAFDQQMAESPAWSELTAVKEGHCYVLPKELFHFKPNARWAESYAWLSEILYPGLSPELRPAIEESVLK